MVDDLGAILVIAVFFSHGIDLVALAGALGGPAAFFLPQRFRVRGWWWYVPLGSVIRALTYRSGVHATVASVAMGLLPRAAPDPGEAVSPGGRTEHLLRPVSAAVAVPLVGVFAAGVSVTPSARTEVFTRPEPLGVVMGLMGRWWGSSAAPARPRGSPVRGSIPSSPGRTSSPSRFWSGSTSPCPC